MNNQKILIIDDDVDLLHLAGLLFKKAGAQVFTARDGLEGMSKLFTHQPDLIVLDVMMPGHDGFEVCKRIRQVSNAPLIMLTALNHEQEMLRGLEAGADDFLSKPFNAEILLARAKAVLRRSNHPNSQPTSFEYSDGNLKIDIEKRHVLVRGRNVKLTPVEFRLLVYLARNAGKVLTFEQILANVWAMNTGAILIMCMFIFRISAGNSKKRPKAHPILGRFMELVTFLKSKDWNINRF